MTVFVCDYLVCYILFQDIKPDENGLYKIGDTMFTGDQLLWLYGTNTNDTDNNDSDRNAAEWAFAKWPGMGDCKYTYSYAK